MENFHFRVPVTLDVSVSLGTTEATDTTAKQWRSWPKNAHEKMVRGEWLLVRFLASGGSMSRVRHLQAWFLDARGKNHSEA